MLREIKIEKIDGEIINTRINGTDKEIINFYNDNNFLGSFSNEYTQIKQLTIITEGKDTNLTGCIRSNKVYPFSYNKKAECYLYL